MELLAVGQELALLPVPVEWVAQDWRWSHGSPRPYGLMVPWSRWFVGLSRAYVWNSRVAEACMPGMGPWGFNGPYGLGAGAESVLQVLVEWYESLRGAWAHFWYGRLSLWNVPGGAGMGWSHGGFPGMWLRWAGGSLEWVWMECSAADTQVCFLVLEWVPVSTEAAEFGAGLGGNVRRRRLSLWWHGRAWSQAAASAAAFTEVAVFLEWVVTPTVVTAAILSVTASVEWQEWAVWAVHGMMPGAGLYGAGGMGSRWLWRNGLHRTSKPDDANADATSSASNANAAEVPRKPNGQTKNGQQCSGWNSFADAFSSNPIGNLHSTDLWALIRTWTPAALSIMATSITEVSIIIRRPIR